MKVVILGWLLVLSSVTHTCYAEESEVKPDTVTFTKEEAKVLLDALNEKDDEIKRLEGEVMKANSTFKMMRQKMEQMEQSGSKCI